MKSYKRLLLAGIVFFASFTAFASNADDFIDQAGYCTSPLYKTVLALAQKPIPKVKEALIFLTLSEHVAARHRLIMGNYTPAKNRHISARIIWAIGVILREHRYTTTIGLSYRSFMINRLPRSQDELEAELTQILSDLQNDALSEADAPSSPDGRKRRPPPTSLSPRKAKKIEVKEERSAASVFDVNESYEEFAEEVRDCPQGFLQGEEMEQFLADITASLETP